MKKLFLIAALILTLALGCQIACAETRTSREALSWANARLSEGWQQDYDRINGCQDIDLIKYYFAYLGERQVYGYAYVYTRCALPSGWTRSSIPQVGDIVVWGANVGAWGRYGHVGIVTAVGGSNITYIATNDGAVQCTQHTISRTNASCYIHPAFASYASLTLSFRVDGRDVSGYQSAGTADVYVNGVRVADDAYQYSGSHPDGSAYEIRDIKPAAGYSYTGVSAGKLTGTLTGAVQVKLGFDKYVAPVITGASVIVNSADVPVRNYPSTSGGILGYAVRGSAYTYLNSTVADSRGVNWYAVSYYGQNGWISSRLSSLKEDSQQYGSGDRVDVISGDTNIRSLPNLSSKILGVAYKGTSWSYLGESSVDERGITWYKISYNGSYAWISAKYTQLVKSGGSGWDDWSYSDPKLSSVSQSAYLVNNNPVVDGKKAFDSDTSTCWSVSEYNYSFGQWVEATYNQSRTVSGFSIVNGYNKIKNNNDYWQLNSRVSNLAVYCDGMYIGAYKLSDTRSSQYISFGKTVTGKSFRFVIRGAYAGTKYSDVCISEIVLY